MRIIEKAAKRFVLETGSFIRYVIQQVTQDEDLLSRIANRYRSDKGTRKILQSEGDRQFYTPIYHSYFSKIRNDHLLEIGIGSGASIKIWGDYFTDAALNFIDINDHTRLNTKRIRCFKGDQSSRDDLNRIAQTIGQKFDIIIDDGGHYMVQQQTSLGVLFKYLKDGGLYFIEDLVTSHWPYNEYKSVYNNIPIDTNKDKSNSTLNMLLNFIETKKMRSLYLREEEMYYLNGAIKSCEIHDTIINKYGPNHLGVIIKNQ
ncbi:hypothetical protein HY745_08835 [Candidatus Desantisbacteria bacterium]|nr:hypothetical protein [Candidatus Desantisbacteria bacterium]